MADCTGTRRLLLQVLFEAPGDQLEFSLDRVEQVGHLTDPPPPLFLVETDRAFVADRDRQPGRLHAEATQARLAVVDELSGNVRPTRDRGDIKLIQLICLDRAEPQRAAGRPDHAGVWQRVAHSFTKVLQGTQTLEFRWHHLRVRILPAVVPELRQVVDLARFGLANVHERHCRRQRAGAILRRGVGRTAAVTTIARRKQGIAESDRRIVYFLLLALLLHLPLLLPSGSWQFGG